MRIVIRILEGLKHRANKRTDWEAFQARLRKRWALTAMYAFTTMAGIWAFAFPSQAVLTALQTGLTILWASFLFFGSMACLIGRLRDRLGGELVGIPLVSASCIIFAFALFGYGSSAASISIGFVFFGLGIGILDRWTHIRKLLRASDGSR